MPKWPWTSRHFSFDYPVEKHPDIVQRFAGAPARVEDLARGLSPDILTKRDAPDRWSIQENIGHLLDLEPLLDGRIDDFLAGEEVLRAADMTNAATREADHNAAEAGALMRRLREERARIVRRLEGLTMPQFALTATHPRLKQPMRLVDAVTFACEHDDYHIARIAELRRMFSPTR